MDVQDVLFELVEELDRLKVSYAVMGGLAVRIYALPRPTQDVDLTVGIEPGDSPEFLKKLQSAGFDVPDSYAKGWADKVADMPLVKVSRYVGDRSIDVDLFLTASAFQRSLMTRRQPIVIEGRSLWFISPEDLLLTKIVADRPRDKIDVQDLLFTLGDLDNAYLKEWATALGISEKMQEAYDEFNK